MFKIIGILLMTISTVFIGFGLYGIFKFDNFYPRILVASKVDTVGYITLMLGVIVYKGVNFFSLKVLMIIVLMILVNPLSSHLIARSAYLSGYKVGRD